MFRELQQVYLSGDLSIGVESGDVINQALVCLISQQEYLFF